ncbi:MAG: GNAT family protein [Bacteroidia bacterium]
MNTDKITLRAVEPRDAQLMYQWENDRRNWYVSGTTSPMPLFIIEQFTHPENQDVIVTKQLRLIIELNSNKQTIGYVDLFDVDLLNRKAGVGILIGDETQSNKGYALEALQLLKTYVTETLNMNQLFCNIHETNAKSLHLFNKAGFTQSGILKNWSFINGSFENVVVMQCFL